MIEKLAAEHWENSDDDNLDDSDSDVEDAQDFPGSMRQDFQKV